VFLCVPDVNTINSATNTITQFRNSPKFFHQDFLFDLVYHFSPHESLSITRELSIDFQTDLHFSERVIKQLNIK
jgi:hypothetical protein